MSDTITSDRVLLDYNAAADYLSTTYHQLRRMVYERRIPYIKIGRKVRFDRADLDAYIDAQRVPAEVAS